MKKLITVLAVALYLVFLSFQPALAGAPRLQWQKTFGGSDYDEGFSVQQTTDGGYIIAGYTSSYGAGNSDFYLIKTDPNGNSEWEKTFGGIVRDYAGSVHQTADGGYIIAGTTWSYSSSVYYDVYLIKTDPNGNSVWQKTFGGTGGDQGQSVQQTTDGGYIIAGSANVSFSPSFSSDVYLIKTDLNGNSQWQKTFSGDDSAYGRSVQQTTDGGYIIAGYTRSSDPTNFNVYLIKTDPNGNSQWQKTFGGTSACVAFSVQQTSDGGYIIAGEIYSDTSGDYDVYLIKTDPNGNDVWQNTFGGTDDDTGCSVQQTSDGGYIIAGYTKSYGEGARDVYLIKTEPNGNSQWQKTLGANSDDYGYSVRQTTDVGYIIAGTTYSYGAGTWDVYLIKLCPDGTLSADFNCNGTVYFEDLEVLVGQWLQPPGIVSADITPEPGDGIVNFLDFRILANDWLQSTIP